METKPMTVYLAGPMTGYPDFNYPAFHATAKVLREKFGMTVINPAENFGGDQTLPREAYLRMAEEQIAQADAVVLLRGWEESNGVHRELTRYFERAAAPNVMRCKGDSLNPSLAPSTWLANQFISDPAPVVPPHPHPIHTAWMVDTPFVRPMGCGETEDVVEQATAKPTNPKDALGVNKIPLHLVPPTAIAACAMALGHGALKYGRMNWRVVGVRASVYYDAIRRHLDAWFEGHNHDEDSDLSHLDHAIAGLAILIDAKEMGKLTDDRNVYNPGYSPLLRLFNEKWKTMRADAEAEGRTPTHYSRENTVGEF